MYICIHAFSFKLDLGLSQEFHCPELFAWRLMYKNGRKAAHLFLDVLQQEGGGAQVVHREAEESLDLFLVQVHGDDVS